MYSRQEDAELLLRVGAGDEAALEAVYQRYGSACYRLARRLLDDAQLAEDVVQQAKPDNVVKKAAPEDVVQKAAPEEAVRNVKKTARSASGRGKSASKPAGRSTRHSGGTKSQPRASRKQSERRPRRASRQTT